jgi:hypothetical protein
MCGGEVQEFYIEKLAACLKCDFYHSHHYGRSYSDMQYKS